jgi:hypothetical protein
VKWPLIYDQEPMLTTIKRPIKRALKVDDKALAALYENLKSFEGPETWALRFSTKHLGDEETVIHEAKELEQIPNTLARRVISLRGLLNGVEITLTKDAWDSAYEVTGAPPVVAQRIKTIEDWLDRCTTPYTWAAMNSQLVITLGYFCLSFLVWFLTQPWASVSSQWLEVGLICLVGSFAASVLTDLALRNTSLVLFPRVVFTINGGDDFYKKPEHRRRVLGFSLAISVIVAILIRLLMSKLGR